MPCMRYKFLKHFSLFFSVASESTKLTDIRLEVGKERGAALVVRGLRSEIQFVHPLRNSE